MFGVFTILSIAMIAIMGISLQNSYHKKMLEQKISQVQGQCNILSTQIQTNQFRMSGEAENLSVEIDQLANVLEGRIIVVDATYKIIKDTYTIEQGKYMLSEELFQVMRGENAGTNHYTLMDNYVELMVPIIDANTKDIRGVIIATVSIKDLLATQDYMKSQSNVLYALFIVLTFVTALAMAYMLPRGIRTLDTAVTHMAEGHMDEPISLKGYTELEELTEDINQVIIKMQQLEDSRQEFVSNVSHELKTPLTSMKVLADSLVQQEGMVPIEMYQEFMGDIVDEIDRENEIINDLLTLIKMDKKAVDLNIQVVNMNALLELVLKRIRPLAAKRNIEVVYESIREVNAEIDEVKLTLALSNLIENAIKYNIENGWVKVSLNADHKFFYVKVADSGVGIPEDCQDKVFERFYRVDKARSRETGGTGLGLAITRNAILMHKGAIKLYSKPGEGTTFTMRIPLTYIG